MQPQRGRHPKETRYGVPRKKYLTPSGPPACGDIVIDGSFGLPNGPARQFYVHNVSFTNVTLNNGRSIALNYCDGIEFNNVRCADGSQPPSTLTETNYNVLRDHKPLTP